MNNILLLGPLTLLSACLLRRSKVISYNQVTATSDYLKKLLRIITQVLVVQFI